MDAWWRQTPRGQLGFPKARGELRELKEFADGQVQVDQWKKRWLWKTRVLERQHFTCSDEARDKRAGVGAVCAAKRLERGEGGCIRRVHRREHLSLFYFPLATLKPPGICMYTMLYRTRASLLKTFE